MDTKVKHKQGFSHESQKAVSVEWYTPPSIFETMGVEFDIDVCSPKGGLPWVTAKKFYCKEDDGLSKEWKGNVWCNPPYGKETSAWLEKLSQHGEGIALVFSRTDCKWFHDYVSKADAVMFLKGRVKFVDGNGLTGGSGAGNGSILVAYGAKNVDAISKFSGLLVKLK